MSKSKQSQESRKSTQGKKQSEEQREIAVKIQEAIRVADKTAVWLKESRTVPEERLRRRVTC